MKGTCDCSGVEPVEEEVEDEEEEKEEEADDANVDVDDTPVVCVAEPAPASFGWLLSL